MRVLVTGSAGYIGPVVVRALQERGHTVLGYDLEWFAQDQRSDFRMRADIRDAIVHAGWPDVVVHLAGLSNDPLGEVDPELTDRINYRGTTAVIGHHPAARHVVISSCAVYGVQETPAVETTPVNPQTRYAWAKADVDGFLEWERPDAVSLRLGTVFGWAPNHRLDLVVNRMVFDAVTIGEVTVNGNAARPLTHVEDVASAVVWAVEGDATGVYNVVGENVRMLDLARSIARFGGARVIRQPGGADTRDYMASGSKLLAAGWAPTRSVEGSLPSLFTVTQGLRREDLPHYIRLDQLRRRIDAGELDPTTLRRAA